MKLKCVALVAALLVSASAAQAQMKVYARSGAWEARAGFNDNGDPMCGMSVYGDQRKVMVKWQVGTQKMFVQLWKRSWNIPADASMPLVIQFDKMTPFEGTAYAKSTNRQMIE